MYVAEQVIQFQSNLFHNSRNTMICRIVLQYNHEDAKPLLVNVECETTDDSPKSNIKLYNMLCFPKQEI